jgi:hypothetical protein
MLYYITSDLYIYRRCYFRFLLIILCHIHPSILIYYMIFYNIIMIIHIVIIIYTYFQLNYIS